MANKTNKLVIAMNIGLACCSASAIASNTQKLWLPEASSSFGELKLVIDQDSTGEAKDKTETKTKEIKNKDTATKDTDTEKDSKSQGDLVALDEAFLLFLAEVEDVDGDLLHPVDVDTELNDSVPTNKLLNTEVQKKVNDNNQSDSEKPITQKSQSGLKIENKKHSASAQKPSAKKVKDDDNQI